MQIMCRTHEILEYTCTYHGEIYTRETTWECARLMCEYHIDAYCSVDTDVDTAEAPPMVTFSPPACSRCGTSNIWDDIKDHGDGNLYCASCAFKCSKCSEVRVGSRVIQINGDEKWCRSCYDDAQDAYQIKQCGYCDKRWSVGHADEPTERVGFPYTICSPCYTGRFWLCTRCTVARYKGEMCNGCGYNEDGTKPRCKCGHGTEDSPVHDYSCRPTLVFHGKSKQRIHMGFELETKIGTGGSDTAIRDAAIFAMNALQPPEIAQLKHDSSIGGGFEIVTQPHTFEAYKESQLLWDTIDTLRKYYKARSWDAKTCGLHVHVSRNGFTDGGHTHRFIEFIYRNSEMLMKFAGRKDKNYATFSDCWSTDKYERPMLDLTRKLQVGSNKGARAVNSTERHSAVNTQNKDTIEVRFLRGTMNPSGVRAGLGLVHAMVQYTRAMVVPLEAIREQVFNWQDFDKFVQEHVDEYKDLADRMPLIKDIDIDHVPDIDA